MKTTWVFGLTCAQTREIRSSVTSTERPMPSSCTPKDSHAPTIWTKKPSRSASSSMSLQSKVACPRSSSFHLEFSLCLSIYSPSRANNRAKRQRRSASTTARGDNSVSIGSSLREREQVRVLSESSVCVLSSILNLCLFLLVCCPFARVFIYRPCVFRLIVC